MSERPLSTQAPRLTLALFAGLGLVSLALTAAIYALAFGPARLLSRIGAGSWTPHAPRLQLLADASPAIQLHVLAVTLALAVGLVLLAGVKGSRLHRLLGWGWVVLMTVGAGVTLFIREANHGRFGWLHLFTAVAFISLPLGVIAARRHKVRRHGLAMTGLFTGGLVVAGATAFLPGRLMWRMFFG